MHGYVQGMHHGLWRSINAEVYFSLYFYNSNVLVLVFWFRISALSLKIQLGTGTQTALVEMQ